MNIQIHGHRGGVKNPEDGNTINAIKHGLQCGVDGIEVDIRMTCDHQLVLHHDEEINKLGALQNLSLLQVRDDSKSIPTLQEFFALMKQPQNERVILNLEMKQYEGMQRELYLSVMLDEIEKSQLPTKRIFLQSFDAELMKMAKQMRTNWQWKIGFTTDKESELMCKEKYSDMDVLSCDYRIIDKEWVTKIHALGLEVYVWTVNQKRDIAKMINFGVDAIITDCPQTAAHVSQNLGDYATGIA